MIKAAKKPEEARGAAVLGECREALVEAVTRLEGICRRIERGGDFLSAWTIREVTQEITTCVRSQAFDADLGDPTSR